MNKKHLIALLMAFVLAAACLPCSPVLAAEEPGTQYGTYIPGSHIVRGAASVSVMLTGSKRNPQDPEAWKKEIRVFPFDPGTGLAVTGEGREPGDEVKWVKWLEDGFGYTVQLLQPGKYVLSGVPYYVLDPADERHTALLDELDAALQKADAKTQKATGTGLYKWILKRVKTKVPEEMADTCRDPLNALLTGYASPEAYAPLLRTVMSLARIPAVVVDGTRTVKKEEIAGTWAVCELDGKWLWTDPAPDAGKTDCFAKEESDMRKDHTLSGGAESFVAQYIRSNYMDVLMRDDLDTAERLIKQNRNEGNSHEIAFIDGPLYSVGPGEPVTLRIYSNYVRDLESEDPETDRYNILHNILCEKHIYNDQYHFFKGPWTNEPDFEKTEIKPEDVEILEYSKDLTRIVLRFKTPGLYKTWFLGDDYCVLDPEDPEQVEIGRLLDEARDIPRGETDRETAKKLQDWEASKLKYDRQAYKIIYGFYWDDSPIATVDMTRENFDLSEASQDAFGALASGTAVCGGYSNLYTLLLRNAGIPAFKVSGYLNSRKMGHAWNILRMDGEWLYADPTWDDSGRSSSGKYFAQTVDQYMKHHAGDFAGEDSFATDMFETSVYSTMRHRFDTRYAVRLEMPDMLRALPGDVSAYSFPEKDPAFYPITTEVSDDSIKYDFGNKKVNIAFSIHDARGEEIEAYDLDDKNMYTSDRRPDFDRFPKGQIVDLLMTDYLGPGKPAGKSSISQEYIWSRTVLEETNYSYSVPMKRNEIRGYSEKSRRTWTYDMDLRKKAMSWELEKDGTTLTVTAHFDENGKTVRASVLLTPPSGGNGLGWETTRDGRITSLRVDDGDDTYILTDMTDTWKQIRYEVYLRKLLRKYPAISENEPLPEGVRVYRFSKDILVTSADTMFMFRPGLYNGDPIATADELFFWDEDGRLQVNPDARDLNGTPIALEMGKTMDFSMATRILITD